MCTFHFCREGCIGIPASASTVGSRDHPQPQSPQGKPFFIVLPNPLPLDVTCWSHVPIQLFESLTSLALPSYLEPHPYPTLFLGTSSPGPTKLSQGRWA